MFCHAELVSASQNLILKQVQDDSSLLLSTVPTHQMGEFRFIAVRTDNKIAKFDYSLGHTPTFARLGMFSLW